MSHLKHIVEVKSRLISLGVNCPELQQQVVERQFGKAIVSHAFASNGVTPDGMCNKELDKVLNCLAMWNEISPINGNEIITFVKQFLIEHHVLGIKGGRFKPFPCIVPEAHIQDKQLNDACMGLFCRLVEELSSGEY